VAIRAIIVWADLVVVVKCEHDVRPTDARNISPESLLQRACDPRTDLFSLGFLMCELATERLPFAGSSHAKTESMGGGDRRLIVARFRPRLTFAQLARCVRRRWRVLRLIVPSGACGVS
jgi:hypothetical protein